MEFIESTHHKRKLLHEGFAYLFNKKLSDNGESWECELRRKGGQCNVRLTLRNGVIVNQLHEHSHGANQTSNEVLRVKAGMKRRAENTQETTQQILTGGLANISEAAAVNLPSIPHVRRTIRMQRPHQEIPNPINRAQIPILPPEYQVTTNGDQFLQFDSGVGDPERILIFGTAQSINLLSTSENWFADGTFKTCPEMFYQLYTTHAMVGERIVPCIYTLLPNKQQLTYSPMFTEIHNLIQGVSPSDIMFDYEKAAMNAAEALFLGLEIKGCFYHLASNIWKKIQYHGLQAQYDADQQFAVHLRMIAALSFVPVGFVVNAFEDLATEIRRLFNNDADDILDYFEDTYIGRPRRQGGRRNPTFHHDVWNMFQRSLAELPRTNNHVEGWHRRLQANLNVYHPTLWKLIEVLKREESLVRTEIAQAVGGHPAPAQRRKYADSAQRILAIVNDYNNRQLLDYLRAIANNLQY